MGISDASPVANRGLVRALRRDLDAGEAEAIALCKHPEIRLFEGHSEWPTTGGRSESKNLAGSSANADFGIYRSEGRFCWSSKRLISSVASLVSRLRFAALGMTCC